MASTTRRDFLATASAATLSALAAGFPRAVAAQGAETLVPTADSVIVLWMGGGMAHTETFDPKRYTPFSRGPAARSGAEHVSRPSTRPSTTSSSRKGWSGLPA